MVNHYILNRTKKSIIINEIHMNISTIQDFLSKLFRTFRCSDFTIKEIESKLTDKSVRAIISFFLGLGFIKENNTGRKKIPKIYCFINQDEAYMYNKIDDMFN